MDWYIKVLKNYAVFRGRARRKEYWMFTLFHTIILALLLFLILMELLPETIFSLYALGTLLPYLAVSVRRLHDTGRSGAWYLISYVPVVGGIIFLVYCCEDSKRKANKYGPNPKAQQEFGEVV